MCGIIGYVGGQPALPIVVDALERMEYRGYDSAGVMILDTPGKVLLEKKAGRLDNLRAALVAHSDFPGTTGMGHTRWATHGRPSDANAHPHISPGGLFSIVHNGIIENYSELRHELTQQGVEFTSDTDTEVAVHLINQAYTTGDTAGDFVGSAYKILAKLEGAFTILFSCSMHPGLIIGARRSTPLVIGVGQDQMFLASDVAAFIEHTRDAVALDHDQIVTISHEGYCITDFDGTPSVGKSFHIDWDVEAAEKGGYTYFMDKEIAEQPAAVADTLRGHIKDGNILLDEQRLTEQELRELNKIFIVACGTAYNAGLVAKYAIEHWTRIPVEVELASEFRYRDPVLDSATLVLAISQSGETLDTLEAVRHAREQGARVVAISNTVGSQIPRESDAVVYTHAGPEIAVASTKCFLAQITASYLVGLAIATARGTKYPDEVMVEYEMLSKIPEQIHHILDNNTHIRALAKKIGSNTETILYVGRHVGYPIALEGALKMKELAYIHAEGFAAGELKHGPIALLSEGTPVIVIMPSPHGRPVLHSKMISNVREIQARGAKTIVIAEAGDTSVHEYADEVIEIPATSTLLQPLLSTVPLQIFASEVADNRGYDIDKPRNLAKSVTVE